MKLRPRPGAAKRAGLSFIEPRTVDDLIRRRDMVKTWMDATCGMFGRSPDFLNIMLTGLSSAAPEFGKREARFADNIRAYHALARDRDLCMTHTLLNPQVDRSRRGRGDAGAGRVPQPGLPVNAGLRRLVTLREPRGPGDPRPPPAPVNNYFPTMQLLYGLVMKCLGELDPSRAIAPGGQGTGALTMGFPEARTGRSAVYYELMVSSLGGHPGGDGTTLVLAFCHISTHAADRDHRDGVSASPSCASSP